MPRMETTFTRTETSIRRKCLFHRAALRTGLAGLGPRTRMAVRRRLDRIVAKYENAVDVPGSNTPEVSYAWDGTSTTTAGELVSMSYGGWAGNGDTAAWGGLGFVDTQFMCIS